MRTQSWNPNVEHELCLTEHDQMVLYQRSKSPTLGSPPPPLPVIHTNAITRRTGKMVKVGDLIFVTFLLGQFGFIATESTALRNTHF